MTTLTPIERPNGKLYRPRKVAGYPVVSEDDFVIGIVVLGTHDLNRARPLADSCARLWTDPGCVAVDPQTGWFRLGYECGSLVWLRDEVRGRAGVMFREIVEVSS